jgi:hypothetical protein
MTRFLFQQRVLLSATAFLAETQSSANSPAGTVPPVESEVRDYYGALNAGALDASEQKVG